MFVHCVLCPVLIISNLISLGQPVVTVTAKEACTANASAICPVKSSGHDNFSGMAFFRDVPEHVKEVQYEVEATTLKKSIFIFF